MRRRRIHKSRSPKLKNAPLLVGSPELAPVVERNIQAIAESRLEAERERTRQERVADWTTRFAGSMPFVWFHVVWFGFWILLNLGLFGMPIFDPFPYGLLTMVVSLEAIFLSTFILVSQNRQAQLVDRHAELDLQVNLLAEHEITRILSVVTALAEHSKIKIPKINAENQELTKDVRPEVVLHELKNGEVRPTNMPALK